MLEKFVLNKASKSMKFAHLMFWYIVAGLDDNDSIQLSQHKNPKIWALLHRIINTWEREGSIMNEELK